MARDAEMSLIARANQVLVGAPALLEAIGWGRAVEREFFAHDCERLPEPRYEIDAGAIRERIDRLESFQRELGSDDALTHVLRSQVESHILGARMVLAAGTPELYRLSAQVYGSAKTTWFDGDSTNLDFAAHLKGRLGPAHPPTDKEDAPLDAGGLAGYLKERLSKRKAAPELDILLDEDLGAKAIAGRTRLRIRADAMFELEEARSLYLHEIETHIFTAQNGAAQPHLRCLMAGGPRATKTQEGLAVFAELYDKALTLQRLHRLVDRVQLVALAEDGASFIDLYRRQLDHGAEPRSAYLDCVRVFRGGVPSGGAPFTKDACYLAGLLEVYDFLRLAVAHDRAQVVETLIAGRLALEDMRALVSLRDDGIIEPPTYRPAWLRRWDDLLTHFAFTSFLTEIDLKFVAKRYAWLESG